MGTWRGTLIASRHVENQKKKLVNQDFEPLAIRSLTKTINLHEKRSQEKKIRIPPDVIMTAINKGTYTSACTIYFLVV